MGDFVRAIVELLSFLWPARKVMQWQVGGLYVFGRFKKVLPPGTYGVVPWFMEVEAFSSVPAIVTTPRQDITLQDGTMLHFSASVKARIKDFELAINTIDSHQETTQELIMSVLAARLADVDAVRLSPEKRTRLISDLERWLAAEAAKFGVEITELSFTNFVHKPRVFRVIMGSEMLGGVSW